MINLNEIYDLEIMDITAEGAGIGKIDNFAVFVNGVLPGETAQIKITKLKKNYGYGKPEKILSYSPYRVSSQCEVFSSCGGCIMQHFEYNQQIKWKTNYVLNAVKRIGGLKHADVLNTIGMENPFNYRNKAHFPVGEINGKAKIGFYTAKTHTLVPVKKCVIQNPITEKILILAEAFFEANKIKPYNTKVGKGLIRHILIRTCYNSGEIMVCFVVNGDKISKIEELIDKLIKIKGMTSIVLNINKKNSSVVLGDKIEVLWGENYITEIIGSVKFEISPLSFFQVNTVQTKVLYDKVIELANLTGDEVIFDAYCGIGAISLFLAKKAKKVYGIEISIEAVKDAEKNAEINNIENVEFLCGKSEEELLKLYEDAHINPDIIIVDPPRKGCGIEVIKSIINIKPKKLIYVSCEPSTLARDLKILCENGFELTVIQPIDCFPMTGSIEIVASLIYGGGLQLINSYKNL